MASPESGYLEVEFDYDCAIEALEQQTAEPSEYMKSR